VNSRRPIRSVSSFSGILPPGADAGKKNARVLRQDKRQKR
jgi:hypothetical protein